MRPVLRFAAGFLLGLAACGDEGTVTLPVPEGTLAAYFPLAAGSRFVYRLNGDPAKTATLTVRDAGGTLEFELLASDPAVRRIALLANIGADSVDVRRVERGPVRVDLDPAVAGLKFPLREGRGYSSRTRIQFLGGQLGISLFGLAKKFGPQMVLQNTYPHVFSVDVTVQTDLLGTTLVQLQLAEGVGPVAARVVSPALTRLNLEGLEMKLDLISKTGGTSP
jgi:hypothetical protein